MCGEGSPNCTAEVDPFLKGKHYGSAAYQQKQPKDPDEGTFRGSAFSQHISIRLSTSIVDAIVRIDIHGCYGYRSD